MSAKESSIELDKNLLDQYVLKIKSIYGTHLRQIILFGSYARDEANAESDVDIMILLDLSDADIKKYRHQLSAVSFDYLMEYDWDIKAMAQNENHFNRWIDVYPFYANVNNEGVRLYHAA